MKCKIQVGLAIGAGYLLGRRHKTRLALMVGAAALTGGLGGAAGRLTSKLPGGGLSNDLLQRLSPEVGQLTDAVRGELFELGKTAARAAVNSQMDALTGKLHDRAGSLRDRISERADVAGQAGRLRDVSHAAQGGAEPPDDEPTDQAESRNGQASDGAEQAEPAPRRAPRRSREGGTAPRATRSRSSSGQAASRSGGARRPAGTAARRTRPADDEAAPPVRRRSSSTRSGTAGRQTTRRNGR